jgi:hypothetical protein
MEGKARVFTRSPRISFEEHIGHIWGSPVLSGFGTRLARSRRIFAHCLTKKVKPNQSKARPIIRNDSICKYSHIMTIL